MPQDVDAIVRELTEGQGYYVVEGLFGADEVATARHLIMDLAEARPPDIDEGDPVR